MISEMLQCQFVALYTTLQSQINRIFRLWIQTLIPPVITSTLYFLIFGKVIGVQIGQMHGIDYIQYITPGLIMMSVVTNAFAHVTAVVYGARFQHVIDEMLVSPMSNFTILMGFLIGGVVRGLINGILVLLVALCFTPLPIQYVFSALGVAAMAATLLSLFAFINAIYAKSFDDISVVPNFILTPLSYLGGIFYSVDMLPALWRKISLFNPLLYINSAFRYAFFGVTADVGYATALWIIGLFIILLIWICLWMMKNGVGLRQ